MRSTVNAGVESGVWVRVYEFVVAAAGAFVIVDVFARQSHGE